MRSDSVHAVEGLSQRVQALRDKSVRLKTLRDRLQQDLQDKRDDVAALSSRIEKLTKVGELFRTLMDMLVVDQVRSVETVVTEGFRTIFHDQELSFESDIGPKYNKISVDFKIREGAKDNPFAPRGHPLSSFGGGPASVASLILRVLTVMRLGRYPLFILDEALGAVSEEYSEETAQFLRDLSEKMGIDIMLVTQTQKQSFCDQASLAYRCSQEALEDGTRYLALRTLKRGAL